MGRLPLNRLFELLTSTQLIVGLLWVGLSIFTAVLIVLMWTRWGQSRLLEKCLGLSLLAHVLLFGYFGTVQIALGDSGARDAVVRLSLDDVSADSAAAPRQADPSGQPWEELLHEGIAQPPSLEAWRSEPDPLPEPARQSPSPPTPLPDRSALGNPRLQPLQPPEPEPSLAAAGIRPVASAAREPEPIEAPAAQRRTASEPVPASVNAPGLGSSGTEAGSTPSRTTTAGMPEALLEQPAPLPRLSESPASSEPADALASLTDRATQPPRAAPADPFAQDAAGPTGSPLGRSAHGSPAGDSDRLHPPSIPPLAGRPLPNAADAALRPSGSTTGAAVGPPRLPGDRRSGTTEPHVPEPYKLRVAPDRAQVAQQQGATPETEAAVAAALKWLASNQGPDGRWNAQAHGAGRELRVMGRDRQGAGIDADTGMTGLALLAFLASGHTHREGEHRETVRRGLEYLLRNQAADGNLAGTASGFARMYCHAMATIALSEAYGMTRDGRLHEPVRRAIGYTLAAQHPATGGWRYVPADPGDTSQFGWQLMALKSADLAGIPTPESTRQRMIKYLRGVGSGKFGGLASYRPGEQPSRPMTAEALVCWQFLGMPREHPAGNEAGEYLLGDLPPGQGKHNLYYWYYGTLGMYQLQGDYWRRWNAAVCKTLLASQRKDGPLAGSWDTDTVWGGYGGRVYTTALATLCLEVYYRFLPLYAEAAGKDARAQ